MQKILIDGLLWEFARYKYSFCEYLYVFMREAQQTARNGKNYQAGRSIANRPFSSYYYLVAGRKNNSKNTGLSFGKVNKYSSGKTRASTKPLGLLFWALFFILTAGLFLINRDRIRETLKSTRILDRLPVNLPWIGEREAAEETEQGTETSALSPAVPGESGQTAPEIVILLAPEIEEPESFPTAGPPDTPQTEPLPASQTPNSQPATEQAVTERTAASQNSQTGAEQAAVSRVAAAQTNSLSEESAPPASGGQNSSGTNPQPPRPAPSRPSTASRTRPPANPAAQERAVYFTRIDPGGTILRSRVIRRLPASDSPMVDSLQALIAGPNAEEKEQELISLIPPGTRLLSSTTVRGSTAYINFSEDFQYNTFGVEGYAAQLRQVIWTATEFPNIKDVQILIEGRRIDYLGEGIWIGSPLGRESL
jgi:spore germination protein GerM